VIISCEFSKQILRFQDSPILIDLVLDARNSCLVVMLQIWLYFLKRHLIEFFFFFFTNYFIPEDTGYN